MLISDTSSLSRCDYCGVRDRAVCIWGPQPIVERRLVNAFVERVTQRFMKGLGDIPITPSGFASSVHHRYFDFDGRIDGECFLRF